jgi:hypothetical protein
MGCAARRPCRVAAGVLAVSLLVSLLVTLASGCEGGPQPQPDVRIALPTPDHTTAALCRDLHRRLPTELDGRTRRDTVPTSTLTAAWGQPALLLRCGVPDPPQLTPTSEIISVNGVDWFLVETADAYTFVTVGRDANVALRVPTAVQRSRATAPLVDLAAAVKASNPAAH